MTKGNEILRLLSIALAYTFFMNVDSKNNFRLILRMILVPKTWRKYTQTLMLRSARILRLNPLRRRRIGRRKAKNTKSNHLPESSVRSVFKPRLNSSKRVRAMQWTYKKERKRRTSRSSFMFDVDDLFYVRLMASCKKIYISICMPMAYANTLMGTTSTS